jgi:DNA polymerase-3 subunit beta
LADTARGIPKGADVAFRQKENILELACSGRKFIRGLDAEEYPVWNPVHAPGETYTKTVHEYEPNSSGGSTLVTNTYAYEVQSLHTQQVRVPCKSLADMLGQTTYATTDDDSRPVFQAIFTHLLDDSLTMAASDSFRFVEHKVVLPGAGSWEHPVLINAKSFVQIAKLFPKNTGIEMIATSTTERLINKNGETVFEAVPYRNNIEVRFLSETAVALLRPMEGTYPKYQNSIPETWTTRVVCDTSELLSAYQTVWPVARDVSNISRLHIRGDRASVEAQAEEQPEPTIHEIPVVITGPDTTVLLNCHYMLDFLSKTSAGEVTIELTKPECPVLLQPQHEATRYVLMPMSPNR